MKKCPFCAEEIQDTAIKCRYCGERLDIKKEKIETSNSVKASSATSPGIPKSNSIRQTNYRHIGLVELVIGCFILFFTIITRVISTTSNFFFIIAMVLWALAGFCLAVVGIITLLFSLFRQASIENNVANHLLTEAQTIEENWYDCIIPNHLARVAVGLILFTLIVNLFLPSGLFPFDLLVLIVFTIIFWKSDYYINLSRGMILTLLLFTISVIIVTPGASTSEVAQQTQTNKTKTNVLPKPKHFLSPVKDMKEVKPKVVKQERPRFRRFLAKECNMSSGNGELVEVYGEELINFRFDGESVMGYFDKSIPGYNVIRKRDGMKRQMPKENICFVKYLDSEVIEEKVEKPPQKTIEPLVNVNDLIYKTPSQIIKILGKPSFEDLPSGAWFGHLEWDKGDIEISTEYHPKETLGKCLSIGFRFKRSDLTLDEKFKMVGLEKPSVTPNRETTGQKHWEPYYSGEMYYEWLGVLTHETEYDDISVTAFPNKEHSKKPPPKDPFDEIVKALIKDYHAIDIGSVEKEGKTIKIRFVAEDAFFASYIDHAKAQATDILFHIIETYPQFEKVEITGIGSRRNEYGEKVYDVIVQFTALVSEAKRIDRRFVANQNVPNVFNPYINPIFIE